MMTFIYALCGAIGWWLMGMATFRVWLFRSRPVWQEDRYVKERMQWEVKGWCGPDECNDPWYTLKAAGQLSMFLWPIISFGAGLKLLFRKGKNFIEWSTTEAFNSYLPKEFQTPTIPMLKDETLLQAEYEVEQLLESPKQSMAVSQLTTIQPAQSDEFVIHNFR